MRRGLRGRRQPFRPCVTDDGPVDSRNGRGERQSGLRGQMPCRKMNHAGGVA
jgi:hypothetical protein